MNKQSVTRSWGVSRAFWFVLSGVMLVGYLPHVIAIAQGYSLLDIPSIRGLKIKMKSGWIVFDCPRFLQTTASEGLEAEETCLVVAQTSWYRPWVWNVTIVGGSEGISPFGGAKYEEMVYRWGRAYVLPQTPQGRVESEWMYLPDFGLSASSRGLTFLQGIEAVTKVSH